MTKRDRRIIVDRAVQRARFETVDRAISGAIAEHGFRFALPHLYVDLVLEVREAVERAIQRRQHGNRAPGKRSLSRKQLDALPDFQIEDPPPDPDAERIERWRAHIQSVFERRTSPGRSAAGQRPKPERCTCGHVSHVWRMVASAPGQHRLRGKVRQGLARAMRDARRFPKMPETAMQTALERAVVSAKRFERVGALCCTDPSCGCVNFKAAAEREA